MVENGVAWLKADVRRRFLVAIPKQPWLAWPAVLPKSLPSVSAFASLRAILDHCGHASVEAFGRL